MKRSKLSTALVALMFVAVAVTVTASVTFDPNTGTGFVGKGDVQIPFGWNNAAMQKNYAGVAFEYSVTETYDATCEWDTGNPNSPKGLVHHVVTTPKHTSITSTVQFDARSQKQMTGYFLRGLGATTYEGQVPVVGAGCAGNSGNGAYTSVVLTGSSGGALSAVYGGTGVVIWTPPVL